LRIKPLDPPAPELDPGATQQSRDGEAVHPATGSHQVQPNALDKRVRAVDQRYCRAEPPRPPSETQRRQHARIPTAQHHDAVAAPVRNHDPPPAISIASESCRNGDEPRYRAVTTGSGAACKGFEPGLDSADEASWLEDAGWVEP